MPKIISFANQKGGVGKTTTCVNLAASLPGRKLLIDFDPQANATINLGYDPDILEHTIYSLILSKSTFANTVIHTPYCDLLPSCDDLSELDMILINNKDTINPIVVLRNVMQPFVADYDYILIDLLPSKGLLVINALAASTDVIIPMQAEYLSTAGVSGMIKTIRKVQETYNSKLNIMGILATMYNTRTNLSSIVLQEARKHFIREGIRVFDTTIYRSVKFAESTMLGKPAVVAYADNETVQNYIELAKEIEKL